MSCPSETDKEFNKSGPKDKKKFLHQTRLVISREEMPKTKLVTFGPTGSERATGARKWLELIFQTKDFDKQLLRKICQTVINWALLTMMY